MILFIYNIVLIVGLVLSAPWWLWRMATTRRYRKGLRERLGAVPGRLWESSDIRRVIWLHAVSVGEVLGVSRLVEELEQALPAHRIMISTTTRTGQELARQRFGADRVFYCPLDLSWATRAYLDALAPDLLILAETEFWPNLLAGCFRRQIPVAVVNARISDRSWPGYQRLRALWRHFLSPISLLMAQSELDAERLRALGCPEERVFVAGNLKFDVKVAEEAEATQLLKVLGKGSRFLVAGSTLEGEESALIQTWHEVMCAETSLVLVLAPRHPERFAAVAAMLDRSGLRWVRRSDWKAERAEMLTPLQGGQVLLLDTIGELASVYSLAAIAFVGGSLVPAGGHNPLEPAQFGVPIVMGPHYDNFRAITEDLIAREAIHVVGKTQLAQEFFDLLYDSSKAHAMGQRARKAFEEQAGATGRCVQAITALLAWTEEQASAAGAPGTRGVRRA